MHRLLIKTSALLLLTVPFGFSSYASGGNNYKHIVDEAWQLINLKFLGTDFKSQNWLQTRRELLSKEYTTKKAAYDAIRSMLLQLNDPETRLLDTKQIDHIKMESSGKFNGVGLIFFSVDTEKKTKELRIVTALPDTPAARAGLQPKDIIQAINSVSTKNLSEDQAMTLLRGEPGTWVSLTVRRNDKTLNIPLKREAISIQPIRTSLRLQGKKRIGYIALTQFTPNADEQMHNAIKQLLSEGIDGFVIDLRNNPGGLLPVSTQIASFFLNREPVASIRNRQSSLEEIRANGSKLTDKPIVVLVNNGTASAAEVLAGALQDNRRAVLVGTSTYGRGKIHSGEELSDQSIVMVTTGRIVTPLGRDIERQGIKPDYVVEMPAVTLGNQKQSIIATSKDSQYTKAISILLKPIKRQ
ncbi:hypothetical protein BZZ01_17565 [Nostocales cyanobacterium HT-58-2]|nr:hypothetical protein BZZ01_09730 [Nostocales cyanobacterium HT-58-2]ARV60197.1 hypothetical protein BZZ01_17565 [Nostocales cyanobacterium HT-58-2]